MSYGFEKLWECGRLYLTTEALVLRTLAATISQEDLAIARGRLDDLGYNTEE